MFRLADWFNRLRNSGFHHILFWLFYTAFCLFTSFEESISFQQRFGNVLVTLVLHALVAYFNLYFLIPQLLHKKLYLAYSFALLLSISLVCYPILYFLYLINRDIADTDLVWNGQFFFMNAVAVSYTVIITSALKLFFDWFNKEKEANALSILNSQAELKFLKQQINPHFLFNSLNNLYALSLKKDERTPEVILKLSEILRYLLYEAGAERVGLDREIEYLKNYLDIEKLRFGDRVDIRLTCSGNFEHAEIEPMLLLPFVENAFKHGPGKSSAHGFIYVAAELTNDEFFFTVRNNVQPQNKVYTSVTGGIGNENVRKRLNILYPSRYELNQAISGQEYEIQLKLLLE